MPYVLVRHKVSDFSKWKAAYDSHSSARHEAGLKEEHLLQMIDNPNEVVLLLHVTTLLSPGWRRTEDAFEDEYDWGTIAR
jgi:hypothetical protein